MAFLTAAGAMQASRICSGWEASSSGSSSACGPCPAVARPAAAWASQQQRRGSARILAVQRQHTCAAAACRRRLVAAAAAPPEAAAGGAELVVDRQGYRSFMLEGCEFLVAESPDGLLDLADVYVTTDVPPSSEHHDEDAASRPPPAYRRPAGVGALGALPPPRWYQAVPWYSKWEGDVINERDPKAWIWKFYLVPIAAREPHTQLDLDGEIFMLDAKAAELQRCEVHRLAPPGTPLGELRLRIRDDAVTVDTLESIPGWEHVVQARLNGIPALSRLESQRLEDYLEALEQARKLGTIDETEFETAYDVHWLAGMKAAAAGVEALGAEWEVATASGSEEGGGRFELEKEEDVMGGWDPEMFKDLMQDYDDDEAEEAEFDDYDAPATDY